MADTPAMNYAAKLGTDPSSATVTQPFEFKSCTIRKQGTHVPRDGITGSRSARAEDVRDGVYTVGGSLILEPTPEDLAIWFPRILGAAASGTTFALAETLPDFYLVVDRVSKVFTYAGCKVDRATFTGQQGGLITLALEIAGKTESVGNAGTFPSLSLSYTTPYIFSDLTLTLASSTRKPRSFSLVIDNMLIKDRFLNGQTVSALPEDGRMITLSTVVPYNPDNTDLYAQAVAGAAGSLVLATGSYSTTFAFAKLQAPDDSPTNEGRGEIDLPLNMVARKTGTTNELIVTHDSTP